MASADDVAPQTVEFGVRCRHCKKNEHARERHKQNDTEQVRGHSELTVQVISERNQQPGYEAKGVGLDQSGL